METDKSKAHQTSDPTMLNC